MDAYYDLLGTRFRVTCDDEMAADRVRALLAPFESSASSSTCVEHVEIGRTDESHIVLSFRGEKHEDRRAPVMDRLISLLTAAAIDGFPGLAIHAGVVALGRCAVVLAAPSGTGKTTVTAACLRNGFDYLTDEALCIRPGEIAAVPFPKPLALSGPSAELLDLGRQRWDTKDLVTAGALGARVATAPVPIRHVLSLSRSSSGTSVPEELERSTAVATLLRMAFNAYRDPVMALATASAVAREARSWRLDVGDPLTAAVELRSLMAVDSAS